MSIQACAELVHAGDPDRFASAMTGPVPARDILFPLYAFNLEVARAQYASSEPMIARMRLQFWTDTLDEIAAGKPPRAHEVAEPLALVVRDTGADLVRLHGLVDARVDDVDGRTLETVDALMGYAQATAGNLMALSAQALGAQDTQACQAFGTAQGVANWFLAQPALAAAGRGHVMPSADLVAELAQTALTQMPTGLTGGATSPALRAGWRARAVLRRAAKAPETVLDGTVGGSEFTRRGSLLLKSLTGRV